MAACRSRGERSLTTWPSMRMAPVVGRSKPATRLSIVDLPQPLGPTSVTKDPSGTSRSTPRSTGALRPYALVTRSNLTAVTRSPLHRAGGQAAHDPALEEQRRCDHRQHGHHGGGRDLSPGLLVLAREHADGHRHGPRLGR